MILISVLRVWRASPGRKKFASRIYCQGNRLRALLSHSRQRPRLLLVKASSRRSTHWQRKLRNCAYSSNISRNSSSDETVKTVSNCFASANGVRNVPGSSLAYERDVYSIGVRIYIALLTERHVLGVRSYKHTAPNGAVPASSLAYERDVYSIGVRFYIALLTERQVLGVRSYKHTAPNGAVAASSLPYERDVYSIGVRIYIALLRSAIC